MSVLSLVSPPWMSAANAEPVGRDGSWAEGQGVRLDVRGDDDEADGVAVQSDGRVVVAGRATLANNAQGVIVRRLEDGSADPSFGNGGMVTVGGPYSDWFHAVAVQPDGRIVAAGATVTGPRVASWVVRFLPDGRLDPTFGDRGAVVGADGEIRGLALVGDSIVTAGTTNTDYVRQSDVFTERYTASGAPDPSFGVGGRAVVDTGSTSNRTIWESARSLAALSDGAFAVGGDRSVDGGTAAMVLRFAANGTLDTNFGAGAGWRTFPYGAASAVDVLPRGDGGVLVASWVFYGDFALAALDRSGNFDAGFGSGGTTRYPGTLAAATYDRQGRIVTVGGQSTFHVNRFTSGGAWDSGFGTVNEDLFPLNEFARDLVVQPDGKILIAGYGYTSYDPAPSGSPAVDIAIARLAVGVVARPPVRGYWMVAEDGSVYSFGDGTWLGNAAIGARQAVDIDATPTGRGYWVVDDVGHVSAFGDAPYLGGAPPLAPFEAITSASVTPSGRGYWLFSSQGRAFTFGDAPFVGDMSGRRLNGPVLDSIPTPSGRGYYMVASDGGVFSFGDATFAGSMGATRLNAPVQSLVPDSDGSGYWLVASDGGIFSFDATFYGSMGAVPLNRPVTGMVGSNAGYLMVAEDGGIFSFGDGPFYGSLGDQPPKRPIVAVATIR